MGTKMQCKSYLPGYYSVRDLNEDPNNCSWPLYYGDKTLSNTQYYNGFLPRAAADTYQGYGKDAVKQKMLEHEAIFKNQVYELHRLYRIQRDLMDEIKRKELHRNHMPVETLLSSRPLASQITSEHARKWPDSSFPLANSVYAGPLSSGVEGIHSQSSAIKGNGPKNGIYPCQNGISSKDVEVLDSRPTKVRKKMFDLQLPADVYIDSEEGEDCSDEKVSSMPSCQSTKNCKIAPEGGGKVLFSDDGKADFADALRSEKGPRSGNGFADLNEPVQPEEASASGYADPLGHDSFRGKIQGPDLPAKSRSQLLGDGTQNGWFSHVLESGQNKSSLTHVSQCLQTERLPMASQPVQVSVNNHEKTFYMMDKSKVDLWSERTVSGVESSERSNEFSSNRHPSTFVAYNVSSPYPIVPSDLAKSWTHSVSSWEKPGSGLSQKSMSVQAHPCFNSSASLSKSSQSSVQSNGIFGDRWNLNNNSRSNQGSGSELPYQNGFHHGSSSGSREQLVRFSSLNCDYQSSNNNHNGGSEHLMTHGSATYYKGSNFLDVKSAKEVNLNVMLSNSSSNEELPQRGLTIMGGEQKHEDPLAALPWLRAKPAGKNEFANGGRVSQTSESSIFQSSVNNFANKVEAGRGFNQTFAQSIKSFSCGNDDEAKRTEQADSPSGRKLLGFPIFEKSQLSMNESFSVTSLSVSIPHPLEGEVENNRRNRLLDINLPCETAAPDLARKNVAEIVVIDDGRDKQFGNFRHHIDLNFCISDDEGSLRPCAPRSSMKNVVEIDLEAPISPETDDEDDVIHGDTSQKQNKMSLALPQKTEPSRDELARVAAEAIVAISSCGPLDPMDESSCNLAEASSVDPLMWFVDIVSTCGNDLESKFDTVLRSDDCEVIEESLVEEFDYFEFLTLKLKETKEEDYMPEPLVPENIKFEDSGGTNLLSNTPRRGQARRGRQRRDFQRDILPGLVSLSRHEVTEDIQTFGGLMRATGHPSWQSGLARRNSTRNGCARGRRRAVVSPSPPVVTIPVCTPPVQQFSNTEMALEDRSLTGWGKTTRRPRRQRCAAGNPPSLPLT